MLEHIIYTQLPRTMIVDMNTYTNIGYNFQFWINHDANSSMGSNVIYLACTCVCFSSSDETFQCRIERQDTWSCLKKHCPLILSYLKNLKTRWNWWSGYKMKLWGRRFILNTGWYRFNMSTSPSYIRGLLFYFTLRNKKYATCVFI
jgi:hypothetical protein